jgi:hypothetical protein
VLTLALTILLCTTSLATAHRLSGKPQTLKGKLTLAQAQVRHDRAALSVLNRRGWTLIAPLDFALVSHRSWLRADVAYMRRLERLVRPFPAWWLRQALCVKSHEGGWRSNTGNGFFGAFQFDAQTWLANGGGRFARYAHMASPQQQLLVAYWTWRRRGWAPWPATSRMCGLA